MFNIIIFLFILGILIVVHEFGHFIVAKKMGVRVEVFSLGFGPKIFKRKKNNTDYSIGIIPLGGYVKLAGDNLEEYKHNPDEYLSKSLKQRAAIIFAGVFLNYILGILCFWLIFSVGYPALTTRVGEVIEGFGAGEAGIQVEDKIIAIEGKKVETWEDLQKTIYTRNPDDVVSLLVSRGDKEFSLDVKLRKKELNDGLGQSRKVALLGIKPKDEFIKVRYGVIESFFLGINKTWDLTTLTYNALWRMITGKLSVRESVTGPLGMLFITSQVVKLGIIALLHLVAILSINLAIFNLLPLPALDGGYLFLLLVEKIRGKYLSIKTEQFIVRLGFSLIITLAVLVTYNDILRFFGDKITKFFVK